MPGSNLANLNIARVGRALGGIEAELINALGEAVIATDMDGYVVFWNRAAEKLYGWRADEVHGRHMVDVLSTAASRDAVGGVMERLAHGDSFGGKLATRHKDGHAIIVAASFFSSTSCWSDSRSFSAAGRVRTAR